MITFCMVSAKTNDIPVGPGRMLRLMLIDKHANALSKAEHRLPL